MLPEAPELGLFCTLVQQHPCLYRGSQDWTAFSIDVTPTTTRSVLVGCKNSGTAGTGYFDDFSLCCSTDGGQTWSSEWLSKGDMDFENYVDLREA